MISRRIAVHMKKEMLASVGLLSAMNLYQINPEMLLMIMSSLSILQFLTLMLRGSVLLDWIRLQNWREKMPIYLMKCEKHGFQLTYPSGFQGRLVCPVCVSVSS